MSLRVLIIGGYGNFGSHIAKVLARDERISLMIAGRSAERAAEFASRLNAVGGAEGLALDIDRPIVGALLEASPDLVIHTTGPFQLQDYRVARACIAAGVAYCDLADARTFVEGIGSLDEEARSAGVPVITGASSVPCLTAAFIDRYRPAFGRLDSVDYGIGAAQATNRGLSTTAAILSYVGQTFDRWEEGAPRLAHGWLGTTMVCYPELGRRYFGDCDIPDLALFPARYPEVRAFRFRAGHELAPLHFGAWAMAWLVRLGLVRSLSPYAAQLHRMTLWFDSFGSGKSGFHMFMDGKDKAEKPMRVAVFIVARNAEGPNIPCIPSLLITKRMAGGWRPEPGAYVCLDMFTLDDLVEEMKSYEISVRVDGPGIADQWGRPWPEC